MGRALTVWEQTGCQDGPCQLHGYWGEQPLFLTAACMGWQQGETKCYFLLLCRRLLNPLPLAYRHELAIALLLDGQVAAGDRVPQLLVYSSEPFHGIFSFGWPSSAEAFPLWREFYDPFEKEKKNEAGFLYKSGFHSLFGCYTQQLTRNVCVCVKELKEILEKKKKPLWRREHLEYTKCCRPQWGSCNPVLPGICFCRWSHWPGLHSSEDPFAEWNLEDNATLYLVTVLILQAWGNDRDQRCLCFSDGTVLSKLIEWGRTWKGNEEFYWNLRARNCVIVFQTQERKLLYMCWFSLTP